MLTINNKSVKKATISSECVACGVCVQVCPFGAINIYKGLQAVVEYEKCVGCGKCAKACPASVIKIKKGAEIA